MLLMQRTLHVCMFLFHPFGATMREVNPFYEGVCYQATLPTPDRVFLDGMIGCGELHTLVVASAASELQICIGRLDLCGSRAGENA